MNLRKYVNVLAIYGYTEAIIFNAAKLFGSPELAWGLVQATSLVFAAGVIVFGAPKSAYECMNEPDSDSKPESVCECKHEN